MNAPHVRNGFFVVFEGGDGVGKSTQARLLASRLAAEGIPHLVTHEPGGTWLGAKIRGLVLNPASGDISPIAEALLYIADKAQHVVELIRPALARGEVVVCDRYVDSLLAYQGAGRVLDIDQVEAVARWATGGLLPDLTVVLDAPPGHGLARIAQKDRLEGAGEGLHERARESFLWLAERDPGRFLVLDARRPREELADRIKAEVDARIGSPEWGRTAVPGASGPDSVGPA